MMRRTTTIALLAGLASTAFVAAPAPAADGDATVSVLHGVPGLTVDVHVYVNGAETIPDFKPGTLTDPMMLPEGRYDIAVYAWGSAADENLDLAVQTISGLHSDPEGVPTGQGGLVDNGALLVLAMAGVAGAVIAGRRVLRSERV